MFAADIGALEEAETKAATRAKGAATFRDAKLAKVPETRKAGTELSGLPSARTYFFRYRAFTRAGQKDYSQVVSLLVY